MITDFNHYVPARVVFGLGKLNEAGTCSQIWLQP